MYKDVVRPTEFALRRDASLKFKIWSLVMVLLMELAYWEVLLFLLMLFGLISVHLFTGRINTKGLLKGTKGDGTQYFSPERVQLLLFTIGASFQYLAALLHEPTRFPIVPEGWLLILGGSHVVYLGGKFGASLLGKS
jgi:hypothetical protein